MTIRLMCSAREEKGELEEDHLDEVNLVRMGSFQRLCDLRVRVGRMGPRNARRMPSCVHCCHRSVLACPVFVSQTPLEYLAAMSTTLSLVFS